MSDSAKPEVPFRNPDCYQCVHRSRIPGDSHSKCEHPETVKDLSGSATKLGITGNAHGIRKGWFCWPWNFDPTWLITCNGFTPKEPKSKP